MTSRVLTPPSVPDPQPHPLSLAQIAVRIVGLVFLAELGLMLLLPFVFPRLDPMLEAVVDSLLLMIVVAPVIVVTLMQRRRAEHEREAVIQELQTALANVRTLSGLLPICANCKKIRDDRGYWNQIEVYVRDRSDAEFSHGVCPDCAHTLFRAYADDLPRQRD